MTSRLLVLLFSTLFLSCSLGEQLQENRRQKRGIAKMMMHMMWDPVRLIRYWHAYDVTKEIAKSWRKIIPTMVLYPYLGHTPGVAKYMNPTHGLTVKSRNKKQTGQFKYPEEHTEYVQSWVDQSMEDYSSPGGGYSHSHTHMDTPTNDYVKTGYAFSNQEQLETSKIPEIRYGERLPGSHINLESASSMGSLPVIFRPGFKMSQSLGSSGSNAVFAVVDHKNARHVYLKPISHREFKRENRGRVPLEDQHSGDGQKFVESVIPLPLPYHVGNDEDQPVIFKAVPMPEFDSSVEVDEAASSNIDDRKVKSIHLTKEYSTSRHPGWIRIPQDSKVNSEIPISLTGHRQEIHIVLHPIPIGDGDQRFAEQSMHFVPYNINTNESSRAKGGHFSIIMPSIVPSSHEDKDFSKVESPKKSVNNEIHSDNKTSPEDVYDAKQTSRVMWVLRDKTTSDTSAEAFAKASSEDAKDDTNQYPLRLKGQKIDMKQLKQDLKHGTPVLIPFEKKVKFQQNSEEPRNSARKGQMAGPNDPHSIRNSIGLGQEDTEVDISSETHQELEESRPHYSNEEFEDNKSTQRLLLFLAKKPLPYRR